MQLTLLTLKDYQVWKFSNKQFFPEWGKEFLEQWRDKKVESEIIKKVVTNYAVFVTHINQ